MRLRPTHAATGIALAALLALTGCGGDDSADTSPTPQSTVDGGAGAGLPEVSGEFGETPTVTIPDEEPPTEIVSSDEITGDGDTAAAGDTVTVNYHGVKWSDGTVFDSSFERGEPVQFPLDGLIKCWQEGIPGMAVGGRRVLVCPPETAYGAAGTGHPLAGETLVFVVDLNAVA